MSWIVRINKINRWMKLAIVIILTIGSVLFNIFIISMVHNQIRPDLPNVQIPQNSALPIDTPIFSKGQDNDRSYIWKNFTYTGDYEDWFWNESYSLPTDWENTTDILSMNRSVDDEIFGEATAYAYWYMPDYYDGMTDLTYVEFNFSFWIYGESEPISTNSYTKAHEMKIYVLYDNGTNHLIYDQYSSWNDIGVADPFTISEFYNETVNVSIPVGRSVVGYRFDSKLDNLGYKRGVGYNRIWIYNISNKIELPLIEDQNTVPSIYLEQFTEMKFQCEIYGSVNQYTKYLVIQKEGVSTAYTYNFTSGHSDFFDPNYFSIFITFNSTGRYFWQIQCFNLWENSSESELGYFYVVTQEELYPKSTYLTLWSPFSDLSLTGSLKTYLGEDELARICDFEEEYLNGDDYNRRGTNLTWTEKLAGSYNEFYVANRRLYWESLGGMVQAVTEAYYNMTYYDSLMFRIKLKDGCVFPTTVEKGLVIVLNPTTWDADYRLNIASYNTSTFLNKWINFIVPFDLFTFINFNEFLGEIGFYTPPSSGYLDCEIREIYVANYNSLTEIVNNTGLFLTTNQTIVRTDLQPLAFVFENLTSDIFSGVINSTFYSNLTLIDGYNNSEALASNVSIQNNESILLDEYYETNTFENGSELYYSQINETNYYNPVINDGFNNSEMVCENTSIIDNETVELNTFTDNITYYNDSYSIYYSQFNQSFAESFLFADNYTEYYNYSTNVTWIDVGDNQWTNYTDVGDFTDWYIDSGSFDTFTDTNDELYAYIKTTAPSSQTGVAIRDLDFLNNTPSNNLFYNITFDWRLWRNNIWGGSGDIRLRFYYTDTTYDEIFYEHIGGGSGDSGVVSEEVSGYFTPDRTIDYLQLYMYTQDPTAGSHEAYIWIYDEDYQTITYMESNHTDQLANFTSIDIPFITMVNFTHYSFMSYIHDADEDIDILWSFRNESGSWTEFTNYSANINILGKYARFCINFSDSVNLTYTPVFYNFTLYYNYSQYLIDETFNYSFNIDKDNVTTFFFNISFSFDFDVSESLYLLNSTDNWDNITSLPETNLEYYLINSSIYWRVVGSAYSGVVYSLNVSFVNITIEYTSYLFNGYYTSMIYDFNTTVLFDNFTLGWNSIQTSSVELMFKNESGSWTEFNVFTDDIITVGRFLKFRFNLTTTVYNETPIIYNITFNYTTHVNFLEYYNIYSFNILKDNLTSFFFNTSFTSNITMKLYCYNDTFYNITTPETSTDFYLANSSVIWKYNGTLEAYATNFYLNISFTNVTIVYESFYDNGEYTSRVYDFNYTVSFDNFTLGWNDLQMLNVSFAFSNDSVSFTDFVNYSTTININGRYMKFKLDLDTTNYTESPIFYNFTLNYTFYEFLINGTILRQFDFPKESMINLFFKPSLNFSFEDFPIFLNFYNFTSNQWVTLGNITEEQLTLDYFEPIDNFPDYEESSYNITYQEFPYFDYWNNETYVDNTWVRNEYPLGLFNTTYNFENFTDGSVPTYSGWTVIREQQAMQIKIEDFIENHTNVLYMNNWGYGTEGCGVNITFDEPRQNGTIELWYYGIDLGEAGVHYHCEIFLGNETSLMNPDRTDKSYRCPIMIHQPTYNLGYWEEDLHNEDIVTNYLTTKRWYHLKIEWNMTEGWYIELDGNRYGLFPFNYDDGAVNGSLSQLGLYCYYAIASDQYFPVAFDGIAFSWDDNYYENCSRDVKYNYSNAQYVSNNIAIGNSLIQDVSYSVTMLNHSMDIGVLPSEYSEPNYTIDFYDFNSSSWVSLSNYLGSYQDYFKFRLNMTTYYNTSIILHNISVTLINNYTQGAGINVFDINGIIFNPDFYSIDREFLWNLNGTINSSIAPEIIINNQTYNLSRYQFDRTVNLSVDISDRSEDYGFTFTSDYSASDSLLNIMFEDYYGNVSSQLNVTEDETQPFLYYFEDFGYLEDWLDYIYFTFTKFNCSAYNSNSSITLKNIYLYENNTYRLEDNDNRQSENILIFDEEVLTLLMTDFYGGVIYREIINRTECGNFLDIEIPLFKFIIINNYDTAQTITIEKDNVLKYFYIPANWNVELNLIAMDYTISWVESNLITTVVHDGYLSKTSKRSVTLEQVVPFTDEQIALLQQELSGGSILDQLQDNLLFFIFVTVVPTVFGYIAIYRTIQKQGKKVTKNEEQKTDGKDMESNGVTTRVPKKKRPRYTYH